MQPDTGNVRSSNRVQRQSIVITRAECNFLRASAILKKHAKVNNQCRAKATLALTLQVTAIYYTGLR